MARIADAIDVLILNCNNTGYVERCIRSVQENTAGNYTLVVVEQNSKDGSKEWLFDSSVVGHLVVCRKNVGVGEGRRRGLAVGQADWVAMIDSDVVVHDPEWVDKMWNYVIDDHIGLIEARVHDESGVATFGSLSFCMVRRKCLADIGTFDPKFYLGEDREFFTRLEWSDWWKTGYCYSTNVLHVGGGTRSGCIARVHEELQREADENLRLKYSSAFLERTLVRYEDRREVKTTELLDT